MNHKYISFQLASNPVLVNMDVRATGYFLLSAIFFSTISLIEGTATVEPFPNLTDYAPKFDDRIAFIGASPAVIHMAALMHDAGFSDLNIYDKRLGGKSFVYYMKQTANFLGDNLVFDDHDEMAKMNKRFEATELVPAPPLTLRKSVTESMTLNEHLLDVAQTVNPGAALTIDNITTYYNDTLATYVALIGTLFGDRKGHIMQRPTDSEMPKYNKTTLQFLKDNNLEELGALFRILLTSSGRGDPDSIPALYGLMWFNADVAKSLAEKIVNDEPIASLFKDGHQAVLRKVVDVMDMDFKDGYEIYKIKRKKGKYVTFYTKPCGLKYRRTFDYLISDMPPGKFMEMCKWNATAEQEDIFSRMTSEFGAYTIVERKATIVEGAAMSEKKTDWEQFLNASVQYCIDNKKSMALPTNRLTDDLKTSVCYQHSETVNRTAFKIVMAEHLETWGDVNEGMGMEAYKGRQIWEMNRAFGLEDTVLGYPWKLLEIQGKYGVVFIDRSSSYEYVDIALDYNKLLLHLFNITDYN